jgi:hypothetical protein
MGIRGVYEGYTGSLDGNKQCMTRDCGAAALEKRRLEMP